MATLFRLCQWAMVVASATIAGPASAAAAGARQVSPEGAVYTFGSGPSGDIVMTVESGDLHVEKSVAPDGASMLLLRAGSDELRLQVTQDRVAVSGASGNESFVPDGSDEAREAAVRVALARSRAVHLFRALAAQVRARGKTGAFEEAVVLSGAVVEQLAGTPDAIRGFAKRHRSVPAVRPAALSNLSVRPVAFGRITDCWGQYEQYIMWAYNQYLYCLTDSGGRLYIHSVTWCEIQYTMRAESAWFQFLSCSSFNVV